jgi:glycosyltransferase involved in cell wall biosynthesis
MPAGLAAHQELELGSIPVLRHMMLGRALRRVVEEMRPALVHTHWLCEYGWLASRAGLHPHVGSAWGSDVEEAGILGTQRSRRAIRGCDLVLADSAPLADAARGLAPNGPPVEVFHPGVDVDRFSPGDREHARRALGWQTGVPIVLSPRLLLPLYNPELVISAFARVRRTLPDARLVLKHPGESIPAQLEDTMRALGVRDAVDVLGHVDDEMMPMLYRAADVVVSVPLTDSSPATAWETLACGRPLVVSDLPWAREELRDRETAWLSPIEEGALADALHTLLTNGIADVLASQGRAFVEATRDRRRQVNALDARYRSLVADAAVAATR